MVSILISHSSLLIDSIFHFIVTFDLPFLNTVFKCATVLADMHVVMGFSRVN